MSGETAQGVAGEPVFAWFGDDAQLNNNGQVAFSAGLAEPEGVFLNQSGVFLSDFSSPALMTLIGEQAPGLPAGVTLDVRVGAHLAFNDAGQIAFIGRLAGSGVTATNAEVIFVSGVGQGFEPLVRTGDQAAGLPTGETYSYFSSGSIELNDAGQIAFHATVTGREGGVFNNRSAFRGVYDAGLNVIARSGDQAIDLPAGVVLTNLGYPALDSSGRTAYFSPLTGPGVDPSNNAAIYSEGGDSGLTLITRSGDPAPNLPSDARFKSLLGYPRINDLGHTAFFATVTGEEVTPSNDGVFYIEKGGAGLSLVAREGDPAADLGPAGYYFYQFGDYRLNNSGDMALHAHLSGDDVNNENNAAIFLDRQGSGWVAIAHEGEQAPGFPEGVVYASLGYGFLQLNDAGRLAYTAQLAIDGLPDLYNAAVFATDSLGKAQPVLASGDVIDVDADPLVTDLRTVSAAGLRGCPSNSNDLLIHAFFTDGSDGLFVVSFEPSLQGDYNGDGVVDAADYTVWRDAYGSTTQLAADGDGDGEIGQGDYTLWAQQYASLPTTDGAPVPETATALLALAGLLAAPPRRASGVGIAA